MVKNLNQISEDKSQNNKCVTVFGLGFVGLTTALGFAHLGYEVFGLDVDEERKGTLKSGKLPFFEPYMDEVLKKHLDDNFFVTDDVAEAVEKSEFVFYCVGTPYGADGSADLKYLFSAIDETLSHISDSKFRILVTKSTIPPSTTAERIEPYIRKKGFGRERIGVANNPEFLREGYCWDDFINADRIVIGADDEKTFDLMKDLYAPMDIPVKCVSFSTGEFIKYLSNTFLATMISYSNEMAEVAENIGGIQVAEAFKILHMDKRWGGCSMTSYVYPGCGYGGYCLPKDTNALLAQSKVKGFEPPILKNVIATNDNRARTVALRMIKNLDKDAVIGILGLSFKPGSDDVRDAPSARIIRELNALGYKNIIGYDPKANDEFVRMYPDIKISIGESARDVYDKSDIIAVATAWGEFYDVPDYGKKTLFDLRYTF